MEFVCYTHWNQLPASAEALFTAGARESMFLSRPWFENLTATTLTEDQTLLLACVTDGGKLLAILPLLQQADNTWESFCHLYSSLYSPLVTENDQPSILDCLAHGLSQLPLRSLHLKPFDQHDPKMAALQQALETHEFSCHRGFAFYNWSCPVEGRRFADYLAERPAKLRNTITRKQQKLEREYGCRIRLFTDTEVAQGLADYNAVYRASWKAHEQFGKLLEGLVLRFAAEGWLRLAVLYAGNQPAAAQIWFVVHRKASIFRLAYDETWKAYSPGSILTRYLMERVIDTDRVTEIDFLVGNEAYKQDWMSMRRERWSMSCGRKPSPVSNKGWFSGMLQGLLKALRRAQHHIC